MIFKIGIIIYLLFVGIRNFRSENVLLGGYVMARDHEKLNLDEQLFMDVYIGKLSKEIIVNRFYSIAGFILVAFALFQ